MVRKNNNFTIELIRKCKISARHVFELDKMQNFLLKDGLTGAYIDEKIISDYVKMKVLNPSFFLELQLFQSDQVASSPEYQDEELLEDEFTKEKSDETDGVIIEEHLDDDMESSSEHYTDEPLKPSSSVILGETIGLSSGNQPIIVKFGMKTINDLRFLIEHEEPHILLYSAKNNAKLEPNARECLSNLIVKTMLKGDWMRM